MNDNLGLWENIYSSRDWGKYPPIPVIQFIARNYYSESNRQNIKILEVGSGTGSNLWYCAREGFSVIALEGSTTAIKKMETRFEEEGLSEKLLKSHAGDYYHTLDLIEDDSIDAIIDVESLYLNEFNRTKEIVEKCFRKLRKEGRMLSITFAEGTWGLAQSAEYEVDYHMVEPDEGPLRGKGNSRYTSKSDIYSLYKLECNEIHSLGKQNYWHDEENVIKEWVIELVKK